MKKKARAKRDGAGGNFVGTAQSLINKTRSITHQIDADALQIVLRDSGIGENRTAEICIKWHEASEELCNLVSNMAERDYFIDKVDRALEQRMPKHFVPFNERYDGLIKPPMPIKGKGV